MSGLRKTKVTYFLQITLSLLLALMLNFSMMADVALQRMSVKAEPAVKETQAPALVEIKTDAVPQTPTEELEGNRLWAARNKSCGMLEIIRRNAVYAYWVG